MLHCHAQSFLRKMRTLQNCVSCHVNCIDILLSELFRGIAIIDHEVLYWNYDLFVDVLDKGLDKRCANLLDALLEPDIVV